MPRADQKAALLNQSNSTSKVWKSKHDPEITGHLNTQYLLQEHPDQNFGDLDGELNADSVKLSNPVFNAMMKHAERVQSRSVRNQFGSETQTRDQVIDHKTGLLLQLLINNDHLTEIHGAISTGKESVVFHGVKDEQEFAVKIFKTTLNEFKSRACYVEGEHRFRHQHKRQNPRRLIRLWAEKEMRNLKRVCAAGLRCPEPVLLKKHILVLQFVGKDGHAAPKLRDANLNATDWASAYQQCVTLMRRLYQECGLVHCDMSEYNLLWFKGEVWMIDLAQGVGREHVNALYFLQRDCKSVSDFFRNKGVPGVLSTRQLFEHVTASNMENPQEALASQMAKCAELNDPNPDIEDAVWYASFIPQSLGDLKDPAFSQSLDKRDRFHDNLLADGDALGDDDDDDDDDDSDEDSTSSDELEPAPNNRNVSNNNNNDNSTAAASPSGASPKKKQPVDKAQRKANKKAAKKEQRAKRAQRRGNVLDN